MRERDRGDGRLSGMEQPATFELALVPNAAEAPLAVHATGFADFYRQHRAGLAKALALTLGDRDLAAEAADEAMARAYQRWGHVRSMGNPTGWVYRVGLNWATSVLRRRTRASRSPLYDRGVTDIPTVADPAVHRALAALDMPQRTVVVCRYLLGWSEQETAAALDLRVGTVKSRLARASRSLRANLHHLRPDAEVVGPPTPREEQS